MPCRSHCFYLNEQGMEVSIILNKATLVTQLSLFKSLGDVRMGEESGVSESSMQIVVLARLEKKSNQPCSKAESLLQKIWGRFNCQKDDYEQICQRLVSTDQRHSTPCGPQHRLRQGSRALLQSKHRSFTSLTSSCPKDRCGAGEKKSMFWVQSCT